MDKVRIFFDKNYGGSYQDLGPGSYPLHAISIGNDELSSVQVPPGWKVTLWQHSNFVGSSLVLTADTPYVGAAFNDVTSSITVTSPADQAPLGSSRSLAFTGGANYLDLGPTSFDFSSGSFAGFTVEAWVYFDQAGSWARIIDLHSDSGTDNVYFAREDTSSSLRFSVRRGGVAKEVTAANVIRNGQWQHLAATLDAAGNARIFVGGVQVASAALHVPDNVVRSRSYVGRSGWSTDAYFVGQICEVRLWNVERSPAELVRTMSTRLSGDEKGLSRYLRLDEVAGSTAKDWSGVRDATIVGTPFFGLTGSSLRGPDEVVPCLTLDGSQDYVTLPALSADFGAGFTLEAWVALEPGRVGARIIDLAAAPGGHSLALCCSSSNQLALFMQNGSTSKGLTAATALPTGTFVHVAASYNGSGLATLYVNGESVASDSAMPQPERVTRSLCLIGKSTRGVDPLFQGRMAEVRIWTTARSAAAIRAGLRGRQDAKEPGLLACYPLAETGDTTAHDISENGLHGRLPETILWGQPGPSALTSLFPPETALRLNGSDAYVELPTIDDNFSGGFTLAAWLFLDRLGVSARVIELGDGPDKHTIALGIADRALSLLVLGSTGSKQITSNAALDSGRWQHIAATLTGLGSATLYVNGVVVASGTAVPLPSQVARRSCFLGKSSKSGDNFLRGRLAEVRIFSGVRTAAELRGAMNQALPDEVSGLLRYYRLDEGGGSLTMDRRLPAGQDAGARAGQVRGGAQRLVALPPRSTLGALAFDGSGDAVSLPALRDDFSGGFTLEVWVRFAGVKASECICDLGNGAGGDSLILARQGSEEAVVLQVSRGTSQSSLATPAGSVASCTWTHLAASVASDGRATIYVNGGVAASGTLPLPRAGISRAQSYIGRSGSVSGRELFGQLADLRIWTRARSQAEIAGAADTPPRGDAPGLCHLYPMDEASLATVADRVDHSGRLGAAPIWTGLPHPSTLRFEGMGTYVQMPALSADLSRGFTIEAWVYFEDNSSWARIVDIGNGAESDNVFLGRAGTSDDLALHVYRGGVRAEVHAQGVLKARRFLHIAASLTDIASDGSTGLATLYVDGVEQESQRIHTPRAAITRSRAFIGKSNWSADELFRGRMSEVRLFDRGRSAAEILASYCEPAVAGQAGLVRLYRLDDAGGTVAVDASGSAAHATIAGPLTRPGRLFEGPGDFARLPAIDGNLSSGGFTLEAWVYSSEFVDWGRILELATKPGLGSYNISLSRVASTEEIALRFFHTSTTSAVADVRAPGVLPLHTWVHIAVSFKPMVWSLDGKETEGDVRIYVNGLQRALSRVAAPGNASRSSSFIGRIDGYPLGAYQHRGALAEVRIWSGVRTADQIAQSKDVRLSGSEPGLLRYYRLDDGPGAPVKDSVSTSPAHASWNGTLGRSGRTFDGFRDAVPLPTVRGDLASRGFTLEAWVYSTEAVHTGRILELATKPGLGANNISLSRNSATTDLALRFFHDSGTAVSHVTASAALPLHCWTHIAATFKPMVWDSSGTVTQGDVVLYVDGVAKQTARVPAPKDVDRPCSYIGKIDGYNPGDYAHTGALSEVRIWSGARTASQILASRDQVLTGAEEGLLHYARLADVAVSRPDGRALRFSGGQSGVELPILGEPLRGGFSLESWVFASGDPKPNETFVFLDGGPGGTTIALRREGTSHTLVLALRSPTLGGVIAADAVLRPATFLHVCGTVDAAGGARLYVNGVVVAAGAPRPGAVSAASELVASQLGISSDHSGPLCGCLTEVRLWSRVLGEAEVRSNLSRRLSGSENDLLRLYPLNSNAGRLAASGVKRTAGTIQGDPLRVLALLGSPVPLASPGALRLDGIDDYVELPAISTDLSAGFALEAWVYFEGVQPGARIIELSRGPDVESITLSRRGSTDGLELTIGRGSASQSLLAPSVIRDRTFMHVAATQDAAGQTSLYVDGIARATATLHAPAPGIVRNRCYLGKSSTASVPLLGGRLADVRLWARARSAAELVAERSTVLTSEDLGLIANYRLDEVAGARAGDATRRALHGIVHGQKQVFGRRAPPLLPPPPTAGSLDLDGKSDWVVLPALPADLSSDFTLEAWVLIDQAVAGMRIFDFSTGAGHTIALGLAGTAGNQLALRVQNSSSNVEVVSPATLPVGSFAHVAVTLGAGGIATFYVGGVSKSSHSGLPMPAPVTRTQCFLGRSQVSGAPLFQGRLAEVRIWSVARSPDEISRYQTARLRGSEPGLVANYRCNESLGERLGDAGQSGLSGWARGRAKFSRSEPLPSPVSAAELQGTLRLDGAAHVTLPAVAGSPDGLTLEAWVYCLDLTATASFFDLASGSPSAASDRVYLGRNGSALIFGVQVGTGALQLITATGVLPSQTWVHVSASVDENGHVVLCKDGIPLSADSNIVSVPAAVVRGVATLGRSLDGTLFKGRIAEARIFAGPRSPRQTAAARRVRLSGAVPGLLRCYPLAAAYGSVVTDMAQAAQHGTVQGVPIWDVGLPDVGGTLPDPTPPPSPGALRFDGASTYVRLPAIAQNLASGFTLEAWVQPSAVGSWARIVDIGQGMRAENIYFSRYGTTDRVALRIYYSGASYSEVLTTAAVLPTSVWTHLAATMDAAGQVAIYVNGVATAITIGGVTTNKLDPTKLPKAGITRSLCYIGKSNWTWDKNFQGQMAEVRLWDRARTAEEILAARDQRLSGQEPGLLGCFRLNETGGTLVRNLSARLGHGAGFGDLDWGAAAPSLGQGPPPPLPVKVVPTGAPPPAKAPSGLATWNVGAALNTGDSLIDTAMAAYAQNDISFDLLGVSAKLRLGGQMTIWPLQSQVSFGGSLSLLTPTSYPLGEAVLTLNKGASPMVYTLRVKPSFPVAQMVQTAVGSTPVAGVVNALLVPFLNLFASCTLLIASGSGTDPEVGDYGKGLNLYSTQKMSDLPGLSELHRALPMLGLDSRSLVLAVRLNSPKEFTITGSALLNLKIIDSAPLSLEFNEIGLNLSSGLGEAAFGVTDRFTLKLFGEVVVFRGGISVEKGSSGSAVAVWGALDPDEAKYPGGLWRNPWGLPGLAIGGFGVELKLTTTPPFIGIGVRGEIHIGDGLLGGSMALSIDPANYDKSILVIDSPEGIDLPRLLNAFLSTTGIPGLDFLDDLLDVRLTDLLLYFAPNGGTIAGKTYDPGISLGATLDLWGFHASLFGSVSPTTGLILQGQADRIAIEVGGIVLFQFSDVSGALGPRVDVAATLSRQGIFYSGRLKLLGTMYDSYQELSIDSSGLKFKAQTQLGALELRCKRSEFFLAVAPVILFRFGVLGFTVTVKVSVRIENLVNDDGYQQSLSFTCSVLGQSLTLGPVTWGVALTDLESILAVFEWFFADFIKGFFKDILGQGLQVAFKWVAENLTDIAEEAIELFKSAGAAITDIAKHVYQVFDVAAGELVSFLGTSINEAAAILKDVLDLGAKEAAEVLGTAFGATAAAVKEALAVAEYAADEIAAVGEELWDALDDAAGYLDPTSW